MMNSMSTQSQTRFDWNRVAPPSSNREGDSMAYVRFVCGVLIGAVVVALVLLAV